MKIGTKTWYRIEYCDPSFRSWSSVTLHREDHIEPWLDEHNVISYRIFKVTEKVEMLDCCPILDSDYVKAEKAKQRVDDAKEGFDD